MNLMQIQYYLEVCKTLNFTSAAAHMHISQPSLSRQIQLLEQEVGAPLLLRDNRKVTLTHVGEVFYREYEPLMAQFETAWERVKAEAAPKKEIRVASALPVNYNVIVTFLGEIQAFYPNYQVVLHKRNAKELREDYLNDSVDILLTNNMLTLELPDVKRRLISNTKAAVVVTREFAERLDEEEVKTFSFLNGKKLIGYYENRVPGACKRCKDIAKKLQIVPSEIVKSGDVIGTLYTTASRDGFAFYGMADADKYSGLVFYEIPEDVFHFNVLASYNKHNSMDLDKFFRRYKYKLI